MSCSMSSKQRPGKKERGRGLDGVPGEGRKRKGKKSGLCPSLPAGGKM